MEKIIFRKYFILSILILSSFFVIFFNFNIAKLNWKYTENNRIKNKYQLALNILGNYIIHWGA